MQVASFFVGPQEYAVDIMQIKEIINPLPLTPVPRAPRFIEGIVELRGAVLPVVDLRKRFETEVAALRRENKYVLVSIDGHIVGLIVDRVREVVRVEDTEVLEAPTMALGVETRFISGVLKRDGRIIILLDVREILSSAERSALAGMGEATV